MIVELKMGSFTLFKNEHLVFYISPNIRCQNSMA